MMSMRKAAAVLLPRSGKHASLLAKSIASIIHKNHSHINNARSIITVINVPRSQQHHYASLLVGTRSAIANFKSEHSYCPQVRFFSSTNSISQRRWFTHENSIPDWALYDQALKNRSATAIITSKGSYSYEQLLHDSGSFATKLCKDDKLQTKGSPLAHDLTTNDLKGKRVSFLCPNGYEYVVAQWAVWRASGVAVPLCNTHPLPELEYVIQDSQSEIIVVHSSFVEFMKPLTEKLQASNPNIRIIVMEDILPLESFFRQRKNLERLPFDAGQRAMIIYTSGTTGRPKGVVSTHNMIKAQATALINAWGWSQQDHIIHVLPLHHLHGVLNILTCALWSGATCEFITPFDANKVWQAFAREQNRPTLFMAVPTIYAKMIQTYEKFSPEEQKKYSEGARQLRLMVSGSAALPEPVLEKWKQITGHTLLERYGMTEIGMALSNPLEPVEERRPGYVGMPLPGVEVKIVDPETHQEITEVGKPGELWVSGPNVFSEYWQKPEATKKEFEGSWFKTGDTAVTALASDGKTKVYKIMGRSSVDIIKSGGYKISALDIEDVLLTHPQISEVAVVGVPDPEWGQRIGAIVVLKPDVDPSQFSLDSLRAWCKEKMASYKAPTLLKILPQMPRNAMGKINKKELVKVFTEDDNKK